MNLEQLRGFVEVARLGHFTRAAEQLHLAQPSLSRQIAALERDLGAQLVARTRGNIALTPAGEALLPLARRMLADADSVRVELAEIAGLRRGRVRLGATPTVTVSLVAEVIGAFHTAHPGIELHLVERGSRGLVELLATGELDLALITGSDTTTAVGSEADPGRIGVGQSGAGGSARLARTPLLTEELVVISAASRPPVVRATIDLEALAALPLIAFDASYDLRATTDAAFAAAGLQPTVVLEGAEMDAVLRFVERGLGVAVVPAMVLIDRPGLRSVRLSKPRLHRQIALALPSDIAPTAAVRAMREAIEQTADVLARREPAISRTVPASPTSAPARRRRSAR